MRISYRQGLIAASSGFLVNSQTPNYVDLFIDTSSIIATVAFGDRDYLISEEESIAQAWGPLLSVPVQYLFWELNAFTGVLTRGITEYAPVVSNLEPQTPPVGLMWWNTTTNKMNVWSGAKWQPAYRVLAGSVVDSSIVQEPFTSQVGLNTPVDAGWILTDGYGSTFRDANGNLFTSETTSFQNDTGSLVKLRDSVILTQANENIPKFSFVYLADGRAALASNSASGNYAKAPIAMVTEDAYQNSQCQLQMFGRQVFNQDWNFAPNEIGRSVFSDSNGALTLTQPVTVQFIRCGIILSAQSIYLSFDTHYALTSGGGDINPGDLVAVEPLKILSVGQGVEISIDQATNTEDGYISAEDFARIGAIEGQLPKFALKTHNWPQSQVIGLPAALAGKANVVHTHTQSQVDGLEQALADKANVVHDHEINQIVGLTQQLNSLNNGIASKVPLVPGAVTGHLTVFGSAGAVADSGLPLSNVATLDTDWAIASVTNLQNILDGLAPLNTVWPQAQVAGLEAALTTISTKTDKVPGAVFGHFASFDSTGNIADSGVSATTFALANATWNISSVNGLQAALDGKANTVHTHVINDVNGLQVALDAKMGINANIPMSQIVGLSSSLSAKVSKVGDTMTGDLTLPNLHVGSSVSLNYDGSIAINGVKGITGQILQSNGAAPIAWVDAPEPIAASDGAVLIGTGTGITSSTLISCQTLSGDDTFVVDGPAQIDGTASLASVVINGYAIVNGTLAVGGSFALDGEVGTVGQVLQSNGADTPSWIDLPTPETLSRPQGEVVYGTGTAVGSNAGFSYDETTNVLYVGENTSIANGTISATNFSGSALALSGLATVNGITTDTISVNASAVVIGDLTAGTITSNGAITGTDISGATLAITGTAQIDSITAGDASITDNLTVGGNLLVNNIDTATLGVSGDASINGTTITTDLDVNGTANIETLLATSVSTGSATVTNALSAGSISTTGNIVATGNVNAQSVNASVSVTAVDVNATGTLTTVIADVTTLTVSGSGTFNSNVDVIGRVLAENIVANAEIIAVDATLTGTLEVNEVTLKGPLSVDTGFTVTPGVAGQFLQSNGAGNVPTWVGAPASPVVVAGDIVIGNGTGVEGSDVITIAGGAANVTNLNIVGTLELAGVAGDETKIISADASGNPVWIDIPGDAVVATSPGAVAYGNEDGDAYISGPYLTFTNVAGTNVLNVEGKLTTVVGVETYELTASGNVSLGGDVDILGGILLNGTAGTDGQIITIDNGIPAWTTLPAAVSLPMMTIPFGSATGDGSFETATTLTFDPDLESLITTNINATSVSAINVSITELEVSGIATFSDTVIADTVGVNSLTINGTLKDATSEVGTAGQLLSSTGTGIEWVTPPAPVTIDEGRIPFGASDGSQTTVPALYFDVTTETLETSKIVVSQLEVTDDLVVESLATVNDLTVTGDAAVAGAFIDSANSRGTAGQILSSNVNTTAWIDIPAPQYFEFEQAYIDDSKSQGAGIVLNSIDFVNKDLVNNRYRVQVFIDGLLVREGVKYFINFTDLEIPVTSFEIGSEITVYVF